MKKIRYFSEETIKKVVKETCELYGFHEAFTEAILMQLDKEKAIYVEQE